MRRHLDYQFERLLHFGLRSCSTLLILCLAGPSFAFDPANGDFSKADPNQIRVLSYNVEKNFVTDAPLTSNEFTRILQAVDPDIIAFQEIDDGETFSTVKSELESILGGTWFVQMGQSDGFNQNALCVRTSGPLTEGISLTITDTTPASEVRGVTAGLIDLVDPTFAADLYVMAIHFKSGSGSSNSQRRQVHADAIVNWMRDARTAGENIDLPANTPMLMLGDTNFIVEGEEGGFDAPMTLLTGDIFDETTFGADSPPDWDGTNSTDAAPYDHTDANPLTWSSTSTFSRLDRFYFTDSVLRAANRFVVNTATLSSGALTAAGLNATDTANAADHLPAVVDFELGASPAPGNLLINEFIYDDASTDDREFVELINKGGQEINLDAPDDYSLLRSVTGLPTTDPGFGAENEQWAIDLTGIVPPGGGLFAAFNSSGQSSGIAAQIQSNLPDALQRQDTSSFVLANSANTAVALVIERRENGTEFNDTLVEALMYEDDNPGAGDRFFRTDSTNSLLIQLGADQRFDASIFSGGTDASFSRNTADSTSNSFSGWTAPDTETAGAANATVPVELSGFIVD